MKPGSDYCVQEFFLIGSSRGKGIADAASRELFRLHPGKYRLLVLNRNRRAMRFWSRICGEMSSEWRRTEGEDETIFEFQIPTENYAS